ncbi:MAG: glycosyltransferase [Spirochaetaceae bacterium]|nr:glycosyltransferase [Spirochaetaceae bacterium]
MNEAGDIIKVSIIIPFYNVEKYFAECLDSLIAQNMVEMEILLIDDCSPDGSRAIAEEYAKKDSRIRIITHAERKRQGVARQTGLLEASGEYLWFIDSDDEITLSAVNALYKTAIGNSTDAIVFDFTNIVENDFKGENAHLVVAADKDELVRRYGVKESYFFDTSLAINDFLVLASKRLWGPCQVFWKRSLLLRALSYAKNEAGAFESPIFFALFLAKNILYLPNIVAYIRRMNRVDSSMNFKRTLKERGWLNFYLDVALSNGKLAGLVSNNQTLNYTVLLRNFQLLLWLHYRDINNNFYNEEDIHIVKMQIAKEVADFFINDPYLANATPEIVSAVLQFGNGINELQARKFTNVLCQKPINREQLEKELYSFYSPVSNTPESAPVTKLLPSPPRKSLFKKIIKAFMPYGLLWFWHKLNIEKRRNASKKAESLNEILYRDLRKELKEIGDKKKSRRSSLKVVKHRTYGKAVKKTFDDTNNDAIMAFNNEKLAIERLKKYTWFPKVYKIGKNFIVYEFIDNRFRLDLIIDTYGSAKKKAILSDIVKILFDLYTENIVHRDIHLANMFYSEENGIKLIDFESMAEASFKNISFFDGYDITGKGLDSPFLTDNMCVFHNLEISISQKFGIKDMQDFKNIVEEVLKEMLYNISSSFFTRRYTDKDRHTLRNRYIYNTFDLPYLTVSQEIGQRDIKKRLTRFAITQKQISNKKVLDIGSNIGGLLLELQKMGYSSALGLEYDLEKVKIANLIVKIHEFKTVKFRQIDVESDVFTTNIEQSYDVVFCFAVIGHLKNKKLFLQKLKKICTGTLYFEGNDGLSTEETQELSEEAGFININFIGLSDDEKDDYNNNRPLFICNNNK